MAAQLIYEYIYWTYSDYLQMAGEIANFDSYALVAVGLFIAGLFAVMVYERSSQKQKREPQQPGTAADTEQ